MTIGPNLEKSKRERTLFCRRQNNGTSSMTSTNGVQCLLIFVAGNISTQRLPGLRIDATDIVVVKCEL